MLNKIRSINEKLLNRYLAWSYLLNISFGTIFLAFFMCKNCGESILQGVPQIVFLIGVLIFIANLLIVIIKSIRLITLRKYYKNLGHLGIFLLISAISLGLTLLIYAIPVLLFYIIGSIIIVIAEIIHSLVSKRS